MYELKYSNFLSRITRSYATCHKLLCVRSYPVGDGSKTTKQLSCSFRPNQGQINDWKVKTVYTNQLGPLPRREGARVLMLACQTWTASWYRLYLDTAQRSWINCCPAISFKTRFLKFWDHDCVGLGLRIQCRHFNRLFFQVANKQSTLVDKNVTCNRDLKHRNPAVDWGP